MYASPIRRVIGHSHTTPSVVAARSSFHSPHVSCHQHQQTRNPPAQAVYTKITRALSSVPPGLPHDVGGDTSAFGPLASKIEHPDTLQDWEVRCHSLFAVLAVKGTLTTDELRCDIESLTPKQYATWTYYEKWAAAMTTLLLENGAVTTGELNKALFGTTLSTGGRFKRAPRFASGDYVRV